MKFKYIEDYLEFIAGERDINGKPTYMWMPNPVLQLATYDVQFVASVASKTMAGTPMTDRQSTLAVKLIATYARQLRKLQLDQPDQIDYRLGIRIVNRTQELTLDTAANVLNFRFLYNDELINTIKNFSKTSQGNVIWHTDEKVWQFGLSEYNLSWVVALADARNIPVDDNVRSIFDTILEVEQTDHRIELRIADDSKSFYIENAAPSLNDFITERFGFADLYSLVDYSGILGYDVNKEIIDVLTTQHGEDFVRLCVGRTIDCNPQRGHDGTLACDMFNDIISWAIEVNRVPICIFNPNLAQPTMMLEQLRKHFRDDEIKILAHNSSDPIKFDSGIKVIYTNKVRNIEGDSIPLLISAVNLMHSKSKKVFMNKAEKICYYCESLPKR